MPSFSYGDYTLSFVKTVAFIDEPELDPSNTDRLHNKYDVTVQGVIAYGLDPSAGGETPAQTIARIREDMMRPRQRLVYSQNGTTILNVTGPDAANGPFPQSFRTVLVSPGSVTVEFRIVCRTADCSPGRQRGWSSNRWEQTDAYDKLGYCTTTTRGVLIGRSDLNQASIDEFRGVVAPAIRNGFQREQSSYTISPDGLRLSYHFEDKEFYLPPPLGALDWSGEFKVVAVNGVVKGSCSVRVSGAKSADKAMLWRRANEIAMSRIQPLALTAGDVAPISTIGFDEDLNGSEVEVHYQLMLDPKKSAKSPGVAAGLAGAAAGVSMYGADLIGTPLAGLSAKNQPGVAPPVRGNNPLVRLIASIFRDPCVADTYTSKNSPVIPGQPSPSSDARTNPTPRQLGNPASITVGPVPTTPTVPAQPTGAALFYTKYNVRSTFVNRMNVTSLTPTDSAKLRAFVDLGPPELDLVVEWDIEKIGAMPELPDPCPPSNVCGVYKLLRQTVSPDRPEVTPTGDLCHRVAGRYEYGVTDPSRVTIAEPLPPFLVPQVKTQPPFGKNQDVAWKFLTVDQSQYWKRCCDASAVVTDKPGGFNPELRGGPGIFGVPAGATGERAPTPQEIINFIQGQMGLMPSGAPPHPGG